MGLSWLKVILYNWLTISQIEITRKQKIKVTYWGFTPVNLKKISRPVFDWEQKYARKKLRVNT